MKDHKTPSVSLLSMQSAFLWSCVPLMYSFLPVYFSNIGFSESKIGILMALGPLMSAVLQPLLGVAVDRSNYKNTILILLTGGAVLSILLFPLNKEYIYVLAISLLVAIFQSGLTSVSETITLESLDVIKKPYGPVRASGTIGYSIMSILLGVLMKQDIRSIFYITALTGLISIVLVHYLPKIKGHQSEGKRVAVRELFHDKLLVVLLLFSMVAQIVLSFYQTFFPIYYVSIGGTQTQLGLLYFISAMAELPFLFFADRIIGKLGIRLTLAISMGVIAVRFLLMFLIKSPLWIYPISILHGLTFIVFTFSIAVYINKTVKKELRATGQTIHGLMGMGLGRIIGSVVGGYLIERFGLSAVMLSAFVMSGVSILAFLVLAAAVAKKQVAASKQCN